VQQEVSACHASKFNFSSQKRYHSQF